MENTSLQLIRGGVKAVGWASPDLAASIALKLFCTPKRFERPGWEKENVASGKPVAFANGLRGIAWGDESRPVVLLVHGWQGRGSQLSALASPLVEKGFRVVAVDGPAHGDSPGERTNVNFFSKAVARVADELGGVRAVIAHSFGAGATALALSRGMKAEKVILVASPADLKWVIDDYCKLMQLSPRVSAAFLRKLEAWAGISAREIDIAHLVSKLSIPALIAHDPADREVSFDNAEKIVAHWQTARLLKLEKVGHRRILKAPAFVDAVVRFVSDHSQT